MARKEKIQDGKESCIIKKPSDSQKSDGYIWELTKQKNYFLIIKFFPR